MNLSQSASRACQSGVDIMKSEALKSALNSWDFLFSFRAISTNSQGPVKIDSIYIDSELHHHNNMLCVICFVSYMITSDFKTIKLMFNTVCCPEMDLATGCTPLSNTKTLLDM
jgi:hypothetical protein